MNAEVWLNGRYLGRHPYGYTGFVASNSVSFAVSGPGTLAAVGSADPTSTEPYRGGRRRVFRGRCLAVVAANGTPGAIRLRAEAAGLETAEAIIQAST